MNGEQPALGSADPDLMGALYKSFTVGLRPASLTFWTKASAASASTTLQLQARVSRAATSAGLWWSAKRAVMTRRAFDMAEHRAPRGCRR